MYHFANVRLLLSPQRESFSRIPRISPLSHAVFAFGTWVIAVGQTCLASRAWKINRSNKIKNNSASVLLESVGSSELVFNLCTREGKKSEIWIIFSKTKTKREGRDERHLAFWDEKEELGMSKQTENVNLVGLLRGNLIEILTSLWRKHEADAALPENVLERFSQRNLDPPLPHRVPFTWKKTQSLCFWMRKVSPTLKCRKFASRFFPE